MGETLGVSHETIRRWAPESEITNVNSETPTVTNTRGQQRPASYKPRAKKSAVATNARQEKQAHAAMGALVDSDASEDEHLPHDLGPPEPF